VHAITFPRTLERPRHPAWEVVAAILALKQICHVLSFRRIPDSPSAAASHKRKTYETCSGIPAAGSKESNGISDFNHFFSIISLTQK
jgi:hypothetical protein